MLLYHPHHHQPSTNGAPQVVAVGFAAMVFFMLLLPMAEISSGGTQAPLFLINLLDSYGGVNVFAILLLLIPAIGFAEAMIARSAWRGLSAGIAVAAVALVLLTLFMSDHRVHSEMGNTASISPGLGSYVLLLGYLILALATAIAAFRARHDDDSIMGRSS